MDVFQIIITIVTVAFFGFILSFGFGLGMMLSEFIGSRIFDNKEN